MKFLLIPENNSLSHIAKCLALADDLKSTGHEVHIAISRKHFDFVNNLGMSAHARVHILSDIQETDGGGFPSFKWFSNIKTIVRCIQEEIDLMKQIKPDRVLGVFRFTLHASSQIAKVPYDSLICGCMIPDCHETLGFSENENGSEFQRQLMDNFFRFAGKKFSLALHEFGLPPIEDVRMALKGERTFLWDFPEFLPLQKTPDLIHVGPISFERWPYDPVPLEPILESQKPLAVISFGTCVTDNATVSRIARILLELEYEVIVAAGGQSEMTDLGNLDPRINVLNFAPLYQIFPYTSLLITHGGQMTVFEALQNETPVLVMPLQPEQAHNGVCLERIGCGARLIPSTHFTGVPEDYIQAFNQTTDEQIKAKIHGLITNRNIKDNLAKIKKALEHYQGAKALADFLRGENFR